MIDDEIEFLNENIEKDKKLMIDKISDEGTLKGLYETYINYYNFFNNEFDSFDSKLSNLSTLVTFVLGASVTIATFLCERHFFDTTNLFMQIGIWLASLNFLLLFILLILICHGQSFKQMLTIDSVYPLEQASEIKKNNKSDYYKNLVYCLYKTVRVNYYILDKKKKNFPYSYRLYTISVILFVLSLILICVGGNIK